MQSEHAGIATAEPIINLVAVRKSHFLRQEQERKCSLMSHQTGAQLITFDLQTIELMNWIKHARPVQIM